MSSNDLPYRRLKNPGFWRAEDGLSFKDGHHKEAREAIKVDTKNLVAEAKVEELEDSQDTPPGWITLRNGKKAFGLGGSDGHHDFLLVKEYGEWELQYYVGCDFLPLAKLKEALVLFAATEAGKENG